jgi:hypothetical protein
MSCLNCSELIKCKHCYDKERYLKIKEGSWKFNPTPPNHLTDVQEQVLIGGLLGDLHLYQYKNQINSGIAVGRSIKDKEYLEYQFNLFKGFCSSGIKIRDTFDKRTNKKYSGCSFRTQVAPIFQSFKNKWYPNNIKTIPLDLKLTPKICAIWFCDDGSVNNVSKSGRITLSLYTDGFLKKEVEFLRDILNKELDSNFKIGKKNSTKDPDKGYYMCGQHESSMKLIKYMKPEFPISMSRKSDKWKGLI